MITPDWAVDARVGALMTTRAGGMSAPPFDCLNLARSVGDNEGVVEANRLRFERATGVCVTYLSQVHGATVVRLPAPDRTPLIADAAITTHQGIACTVLVADCLPVLLAAPEARGVGAAHGGWRGLAGGVVEAAVRALCEAAACDPHELAVWLGPCIGPRQFEVGADVVAAFGDDAGHRFQPRPRPDGSPRWLADLPGLARDRLLRAGVARVSGGTWCTVEDGLRFFSFRRDRITGRMAAAVWLHGH